MPTWTSALLPDGDLSVCPNVTEPPVMIADTKSPIAKVACNSLASDKQKRIIIKLAKQSGITT